MTWSLLIVYFLRCSPFPERILGIAALSTLKLTSEYLSIIFMKKNILIFSSFRLSNADPFKDICKAGKGSLKFLDEDGRYAQLVVQDSEFKVWRMLFLIYKFLGSG